MKQKREFIKDVLVASLRAHFNKDAFSDVALLETLRLQGLII